MNSILRHLLALALTVFFASPVTRVCAVEPSTPPRPAGSADPILGKWRFFNNTTRSFRADGTSANEKGEQDAVWKCVDPVQLRYVITYGGGKFVDQLFLKNGGAFLDGSNNFRAHVTATRIADAAPIAAQAPVPNGAAAGKPAKPPEPDEKEIALAPDWMPKRTMIAQEMMRNLAFFSLAAVNGAEAGKETVPDTIIWGLKWRMPLEEAEKQLPGFERAQMGGAVLLKNVCFPQRSLYKKSYYGNFQPDPPTGEVFKEAHLICDLKMRLVSVELTCNHPRIGVLVWEIPQKPWWTAEPWMQTPKDIEAKDMPALTGRVKQGGPDGRREPYYDYVTEKTNAASRNQVWYQVRHGKNSGVTCIHTQFLEPAAIGWRVLENVRWYLPAPLARKILDIGKEYRSGNVPTR